MIDQVKLLAVHGSGTRNTHNLLIDLARGLRGGERRVLLLFNLVLRFNKTQTSRRGIPIRSSMHLHKRQRGCKRRARWFLSTVCGVPQGIVVYIFVVCTGSRGSSHDKNSSSGSTNQQIADLNSLRKRVSERDLVHGEFL